MAAERFPRKLTLAAEGTIELAATSTADGVRPFSMIAYSGAPARTPFGTLVIDLDGLEIGAQRKPILRQHDPIRIVGYSATITKTLSSIAIDGTVVTELDAGREVAVASDAGFPWQASIGIEIDAVEELSEGESRDVNGSKFQGPGLVVTHSRLNESSFVPLGADRGTSAVVLSDENSIAVSRPPLLTAAEIYARTVELDELASSDPAIARKLWKSNATGVQEEFGTWEAFKMFLTDVASRAPHSETPFQSDAQFDSDIRGSTPISILAEAHLAENRNGCATEFASQRGYELYLQEERRQACGA